MANFCNFWTGLNCLIKIATFLKKKCCSESLKEIKELTLDSLFHSKPLMAPENTRNKSKFCTSQILAANTFYRALPLMVKI